MFHTTFGTLRSVDALLKLSLKFRELTFGTRHSFRPCHVNLLRAFFGTRPFLFIDTIGGISMVLSSEVNSKKL